jgi:anaerobic magnesium-protoporphyrin IX monomethyl ester cyclase
MKQRLILIQANKRQQGAPSLGLAYLASYIRKKIKDIEVIIKEIMPQDWHGIEELSPSIIGIGVLTQQFPNAVDFIKKIKENMNVPIIIGGSHISACPQLLPECCDIGVIGEGEETLYEIIVKKAFTPDKLSNIKGVAYHQNGKVIVNPLRPLIKNINDIPFPARDLLNMKNYLKGQNVFGPHIGKGTHLFTARGCPYHCPFCFSSKFWRATLRANSPEYVVDEIEHLISYYNSKLIYIYDDLFVINKARMKKIAQLMQEKGLNREAELGVVGRCDLFDDETCIILKQMNVKHVSFGMESGNERILALLKNGEIKTSHIRNSVRLARKYGFTVDGSFIIGSPSETEEEMLETLEFIKSLKLDKFAFTTAIPYPGTKFWEIMEKQGRISYDVDWRQLQMINREFLGDVDNQFLMIDSISKKRFLEIWDMFEKERLKLWSYDWRKHN